MITLVHSGGHALNSFEIRQRKLPPLQSTLRGCVVETFSLKEMVALADNHSKDFDAAFRKISRFALWRAYHGDLQVMDAPVVQLYCWEASQSSSRRERDAHRYLACRFAVLHLVRDPAVRAEREAIEISSTVCPPATGAACKRL